MKQKLLLFFLIITIQLFSQNKSQSIGFKENKGQIIDQKGKANPSVKYLLNSNGLNVQLKKNGFSYDIYEVKKIPRKNPHDGRNAPPVPEEDIKEEQPDYNLEYTFHRIDIDFVNSNSKVELVTDQESKDFDNYYNVPNKPEGIVGVHRYKQITYKNIYPYIDVVFSIPNDPKKVVEYNFVIHPKGKISDIQLKFNGAETDLVDNKIQMNVRFGKMEETLPASWIEEGTAKKEIAVGYRKIRKDVYGFNSANSVDGKTVIIDPVPTRLWGTFYGDEENYGGNEFGGITTDLLGNNYLVGSTSVSNSSYATSGAHQTTIGNPNKMGTDGIIVKFSEDGRKLWSSYYGGEEYDKINAVRTDNQNNVIIVGKTNSKTNISTVGSYSSTFGGYDDGFLVKFNPTGTRLWATYYGEKDNDEAFDVDIDKNNNIFMVGRFSINHSENVHDTPIGDGFIAKFNPNGNILWNKLYGGKGTDEFKTVKVGENFIVVGGLSYSADNISTPGVFQENLNYVYNLSNDGIIFKLNLNGDRIWSTYYGGESWEKINAIEIDDENNIYVGGETRSSMGIATPNSFDDYNLNTETGFFAKLDQSGQRLWGSYLGYSTKIYSLVFKNNSLYIGGNGGIDNSITILCAYKRTGNSGGYVGKFSKGGELIWGSYTGGFDQYSETGVTIKNNEIVVGGTSSMNDGIADSNSYQPEILGRKNFYLMKFSEDTNCNIDVHPSSNSPVCIGRTLTFSADPDYNYLWTGPNGFTSNLQNPIITNVSNANNGTYHLTASDNCGCEKKYDIEVIIGDIQAPVPDIATLQTITGDCHTTITTFPKATDVCVGAITGTTTDALSYTLPGTYTIKWNYNDGNGNISSQNQTVTITSQPLPVLISPQSFCIQQNATLDNINATGQNIQFYDALIAGTLLPKTTLLQNGITYYASQTVNGCESERVSVKINIQNTTSPTGNANQPFCSGQNPTIANIQVDGDLIKWYDAALNGNPLAISTNLQNGKTYYASQTVNTCESQRFGVTVSVGNTPPAPTGNANQPFCKNQKATLDNISISGQNIKWYDSNSSTTALANTILLQDNSTYYASQTVGCESARTPITVRVYDTPLPIGDNKQTFCIDENATIADIKITGTSIKWYDSTVAGNSLASTTTLQNGIYYATQTLNNCESERLAITIKVQDTQPPIADAFQSFCVQQNATLKSIKINGENIIWYNDLATRPELSEGIPLENGNIYYASQTINGCESDRIAVKIQILPATTADCINYLDELPFPKFFTPNSDGYNDTWTIDFAYLAPNTGIRIFDRYGKFIKELTTNTAWDGTYIGHNEPSSDYWFTVTRLNGTEYRGHFSLKR
ncbi:gliding motility-associated-like protein [Flavobacterium chryseum]|uniref:Ig-like domain-containing protein n=1 Tax=Flavobacterium sp. P3160 TaxID=2512113 RepID=UPI00105BBEFE|nr:T9SS type B sorting domain-containing protein [Flavobacterium sp. P3160]TDO71486.1 gliding motility-associated-like protein [Flavobacterium sp. P3160]